MLEEKLGNKMAYYSVLPAATLIDTQNYHQNSYTIGIPFAHSNTYHAVGGGVPCPRGWGLHEVGESVRGRGSPSTSPVYRTLRIPYSRSPPITDMWRKSLTLKSYNQVLNWFDDVSFSDGASPVIEQHIVEGVERTIICPATESFVHWRDIMDTCEWGLNFTTPNDAKRFRDCCMNPAQKFSRKANSASSLRLSPPKRIRGQESSISSPNSPSHQAQPPRRAISNPHTLVSSEVHHHHDHGADPGMDKRKEKSATIPRTQSEQEQDFDAQLKPIGILKPPSTSSVYDNVTGNVVQMRKSSHHGNENRNARKSMPSMASSHVSFVEKNLLDDVRPASAIHFTRQFVQSDPDDYEDVFKKRAESTGLVTFGRNSNIKPRERRSSSRTSENVSIETAFVGGETQSVDDVDNDTNRVSYIETTTRVLAPQPVRMPPPPPTESKKSSSSDSPEWPSPPEPLTPMTPVNPDCHIDFDSDALKRMLQSLPVSPDESNVEGDHGISESKMRVIRAKSMSAHDNNNKENKRELCKSTSSVVPKSLSSQNISENTNNTGSVHLRENAGVILKSKSRLSIEEELRLRNKCARDSYGQESYPDSGIGGMTADGTGSVCSGGSSRPHKATGKYLLF
ncbi:hypothetical protein FSP39_023880 [Pinctada imbricata]|uniref:WH1 domain-containing protein n=1 Tax=Pinctada imbricata TaxID=66713 RepID=A0AA88Y677_PINIB|nr:hypothetical protein FSP39_023880 [Pinctada imbricata]